MKLRFLVLSLVFLFIFCSQKEIIIPVVVTTDMHGTFFNSADNNHSLAQTAVFINETRKNNPDTILLDNGDIFQGTADTYYFNFVKTDIENPAAFILNFLNYDAATVGNHDTEAGAAVYRKIEKEMKMPWLSANIVDSKSGKPLFKPYIIIKRKDLKIAVLGLSTVVTQRALKHEESEKITVKNMVDTAKKYVPYILNKEKPDVLIGLFHEGTQYSRKVIEKIDGFNIVFTGHDHVKNIEIVKSPNGKSVLMLGAQDRNESVAFAQIHYHRGDVAVTGKILPISKKKSPELIKATSKYKIAAQNYRSKVVGSVETPLKTGNNKEYLELIHNALFKISKADVSITAPVSTGKSIPAGEITVSDLFRIYPFDNTPVTLKLSGSEIGKLLAYSGNLQKNPEGYKRYYNDLSARSKVKMPLEKDKKYNVVMNSYHAFNGGSMLSKGTGLSKKELKKRILKVYSENIREELF